MPEYKVPGVYVEEIPSADRPIVGVSTSTAGFAGMTERGPLDASLITSLVEFERMYGRAPGDQSYLAYALEGFFLNGGQRCYVARVVGEKAKVGNGRLADVLNVTAIGPGAWSSNVQVSLTYASAAVQAWKDRNENPELPVTPAEGWFRVNVDYIKEGGVAMHEVYDNLSHEAAGGNDAAAVINALSRLIRVWWDGPNPPSLPALTAENAADPDSLAVRVTLANGADDLPDAKQFIGGDGLVLAAVEKPAGASTDAPNGLFGETDWRMGLAALERIDEISLLAVPDEVNGRIAKAREISTAVIQQCENPARRDRFALIAADQGQSNIHELRPVQDSSYGAFYYPWIEVYDPAINDDRLVPPTGHIAGIFARTDIENGVHKAPANQVVLGAVDLEFQVTIAMQAVLNPLGVNCLRDFRSAGQGILLWGARTMSSDPEWRYVNVRRLLIFLEESIDKGTQWAVFEPNNEATWANVRRSVSDFLYSVWRSGGLPGSKPEEAFFVRCDRTTMTQDDMDNGRLICLIGVAPVRPAEFVIFRIGQKTADAPA